MEALAESTKHAVREERDKVWNDASIGVRPG